MKFIPDNTWAYRNASLKTLEVSGVYGRLCGRKLSPALQTAYDTLLTVLDCSQAVLHEHASFISSDTPWWMEIGFGDGTHLRTQIERHSRIHFLGVEVFRPGIAKCLKDLSHEAQNRLRIFPHNVHLLMPCLPENALEKIFILFPDPWPKRRHHKRRLLQEKFLTQCWNALKPQGQLVVASDVVVLIHWMQDALEKHKGFCYVQGAQTSSPQEWPPWPQDLPLSAYGKKAVHKTYFIWKKCPKVEHKV